MKLTGVVFICIVFCCQAAVINGGKDVFVDGVAQSVPAVTLVTTESTKKDFPAKGSETTENAIGPTVSTTPKPHPTTTNGTTTTDTPTTKPTPTTTLPPITTHSTPTTTTTTTTVSPIPTTTTTTTVTPSTTTTNATTTTPTKPTTSKPIPSSTTAPVTSTTVIPPSNRGFDGPSFIGGIVLASGLMAIGFVALKFYRARTELNYHTL